MSQSSALKGQSLPWGFAATDEICLNPTPKRNKGHHVKQISRLRPYCLTKIVGADGPNLGELYDQEETSVNRPSKRLKGREDPSLLSEDQVPPVPQDTTFTKSRDGGEGSFCDVCATIPFSLLRAWSAKEPQIRRQLLPMRPSCTFCCFVLEVYKRLFKPFQFKRGERVNEGQCSPLLIIVRGDKPWYEVAGIKAELPTTAYAWLQFWTSPDDKIKEPYICVSLMNQEPATGLRLIEALPLPRRRSEEETMEGMLNFDLVRSWLNICDKTHSKICAVQDTFKRRLLDINLINVQNRTIVRNDGDLKYAALSYVWGYPDGSARKPDGQGASSVGHLPDVLPKTIEDAVEFTRKLGLHYLWIDQYCIDQEDPIEVKQQVQNMDLVYECAELTIVALCGYDVKSGLPGISQKFRHTYQPTVQTAYGKLMATFVDSMWNHQGARPWDQRGWTLQEGVLSTRCIFFDTSHIFMRCREEMFHDTMNVDLRAERIITDQSDTYFWDNGFSLDLSRKEWDFSVYDALIANYTGRKLTNQSDALDACRGALKQITRNTGVYFLWGIPQLELNKSLLWKAWHENYITRRGGFPSWSWAGWKGRTEYHYWLDELDGYKHLIGDKWRENFATNLNSVDHTRPRIHDLLAQEAFIYTKDVHEGVGGQVLKISSNLAPFNGKIVRKDGKFRRRKKSSQLSNLAIGDQWTLLDKDGRKLENLVGEHMRFEQTEYFFQLDPKLSVELVQHRHEVQLLFIKYWPAIRDNHESEN